jgi:Cys-tRNA(Pro)/Cys-tRNA(Cys) deacylase
VTPSTHAISVLEQSRVPFHMHRYDPTSARDGRAAAETLGVEPRRMLKTLVVAGFDGLFAVALVPVSMRLDLKLLARSLRAKRIALAAVSDVERVTGYQVGAVSPLGQRRALPTVIDGSALDLGSVFVSGGKRGLELELATSDLANVTCSTFEPIAHPRT